MLLLFAKCPKISRQTGKHRMNEDWENPSWTCCVRGWNLEIWQEDILIAEIEEEISFIVIILNGEVNYSCRKKNHSLFHWSILMLSGQLIQIWDVAQEKPIDDHWHVDRSRHLSDSWTGFTRFTLLNETPPKGYMWSGERRTKIQTTSRPDHMWLDAWTRIGKAAPRRGKQRMGNRETKTRTCQKIDRNKFY